MGFNFPNSPTEGAQFTPVPGGITYVWSGGVWKISGVSGPAMGLYVGDAPPPAPITPNQMWLESDTGRLFVYFGDPDSSQWIQVSASPQVFDQNYVKVTARARNRVNNPTAQVSQENGATAGTANGYYPADQWRLGISGIVGTGQRISLNAPSPEGTLTAVAITATTAKASLAATDSLQVTLPVEGLDVLDLLWGVAGAAKQVVLRFNVFCDQAGTFPVAFRNADNTRSYLTSYTVPAAGWTTITLPIPGDVAGTWVRDTGIGLMATFAYAVGSTYVGVAGWQAGNFIGLPGMTNGAAVANSRLIVTDVGLHLDVDNTGIAPPFNAPSYEDDLARCMRYWQFLPVVLVSGYAGAGGVVYADYLFPPMRIAPTSAINPPAYSNASGMSVLNAYTSKVRLQVTIAAAGNGYGYGDVKLSARLI